MGMRRLRFFSHMMVPVMTNSSGTRPARKTNNS
jgi:hypothetical protein